ncbi:EF-hand domain-containing protein [Pseudoalteromonas sp. MMG022]|uniref:EF-hand domain-containing protein n=1 Tax=Pseudoalteromonas sp. MMG022 TaxID=2909978 RepID=UPI001F017B32|nr:EF-hand domain-containing protein [Pseudoalteromonas sp. MMG022]MCF6437224.1 EF-hand domain-containing protein [Pseudoalteromonas sp. MMG022]
MNSLKTLIGSLLVLSSSAALAASFSDYDANQDGLISKEEAAVSVELSEAFDKLDTDKDGMLNEKEFSEY